MSTIDDLNLLHEYRQQAEATALRVRELTAAQRQEIAAIELEFAPQIDAITAAVTDLENRIKTAVIEHGGTVKGQHIQAVYMKGRVSYDAKALDGYSLAHPELLAFRSEGAASVSLRGIK